MTERSSTKLTYADYLLFPDDDLRHEIIEGEHYVTPSPSTRHQRISRTLLYLIQRHLETHPVGEIFDAPFDVRLSDMNIVVPDLVYISSERSHLITPKNLQGSPDLAIEILSASTRLRDEQLKRAAYERAGVEEYWLIDPDHDRVEVYLLQGDRFQGPQRYEKDQFLTTPLLPGLAISLVKVFG